MQLEHYYFSHTIKCDTGPFLVQLGQQLCCFCFSHGALILLLSGNLWLVYVTVADVTDSHNRRASGRPPQWRTIWQQYIGASHYHHILVLCCLIHITGAVWCHIHTQIVHLAKYVTFKHVGCTWYSLVCMHLSISCPYLKAPATHTDFLHRCPILQWAAVDQSCPNCKSPICLLDSVSTMVLSCYICPCHWQFSLFFSCHLLHSRTSWWGKLL